MTVLFWSAVIGAVVGGLIAFAVNRQSLRFAAKERETEHKRSQQSLGRSLLIKMIHIQSDVIICHRCFEHISEEAIAQDLAESPMWTQVQPLAWLPRPIVFTTDELALLIELNELPTFDKIASMDRIHGALTSLIRQFTEHAQLLRDNLQPTEIVEGVATVVLAPEALAKRLPKIVEVNDLIRSIVKYRGRDLKDTENATTTLRSALKKHLDIDLTVTVVGR